MKRSESLTSERRSGGASAQTAPANRIAASRRTSIPGCFAIAAVIGGTREPAVILDNNGENACNGVRFANCVAAFVKQADRIRRDSLLHAEFVRLPLMMETGPV